MNEFQDNNIQPEETNDGGYYSKRSEDIIQDEPTQKTEYQAPPTYTTSYSGYNTQPPKPQKQKRGHSTAVVIVAMVRSELSVKRQSER